MEANIKYYDKDEMYCDWYTCLNCNNSNVAEDFEYCPNCGIKIIKNEKVWKKE